jgi:hypothetical protein
MHRPLVRSAFAAAALLLAADRLAAQAQPRALLVPQVGAAVHHSDGADLTTVASLAVELPVGRGWSLMAEGMTAMTDHAITACPFLPGSECLIPAAFRSGAAAGVMVRPFQLGRLAPYAGVSAGVARWARNDDAGTAPLASLRAGMDVRVAGPFGVRADLVRRVAWTDTPEGDPLYADVFSVGASYALRK